MLRLVRPIRILLARLRALPLLRAITRLGWTVVALGAIAWLGASLLDWEELAVVAVACLAATLGSLLFTIGRSHYEVSLELQPKRVTVGERASGRIVVRNVSGRRQLPGRMELSVGVARAEFHIPSIANGSDHDELFSVPTERRAIIPVGPVLSVRGDPVGLCRVDKAWTGVEELFVHPRISPLDRLGSGLLKDLEGQTTQDLSNSDVAFHTLREYTPGDDRRHIHWKTTARLGKMMVRQFVDTRRSHLGLIVSTCEADYANEAEFELAVSLAASLGVRTLRDEQTVAVVAGGKSLPSENAQRLLDAFAGIELDGIAGNLHAGAIEANRTVINASIVALAVGSVVSLADVRGAASRLATDARLVVLRADVGGELSYRPVGTTAVINVPALDEFARGLWRATQV